MTSESVIDYYCGINGTSMEDDILNGQPDKYIYKKGHLQLAAFFGGPLAIMYILAENFRQLGHPDKIKKTWLYGTGLFIVFIVLVTIMQTFSKTPNILPSLICILIGTAIMQSWQGAEIRLHEETGGRIYSYWRALLIGIISLMVTFVFLIFVLLVLTGPFGIKLA